MSVIGDSFAREPVREGRLISSGYRTSPGGERTRVSKAPFFVRLGRRAHYEFVMRFPVPTRRYVQYFLAFGRFPNIRAPKTFNEKVLYKMENDRRDFIKTSEDKYLSRRYVSEKLGSAVSFPNLHGVYEQASAILPEDLPDEFVMKASYGSGWVKIYRRGDPRPIDEIRALAQQWLDWRFSSVTERWCCAASRQRVLIEELLLDDGDVPADYKFHCFDGEPAAVEVMTGRFGDKRYSAYDMDWNRVPSWTAGWKNHVSALKKPIGLERMKDIARELSRGNDFLRVDLYDIGGQIYFGEMTNFPAAGLDPFALDDMLGKLWVVPARYE